MKLTGPYRIAIEGTTDTRYSGDSGKGRDYLVCRLFGGQEVAAEALALEGLTVREDLVERAAVRAVTVEDAELVLADSLVSSPVTAEELVGLFNQLLDMRIGEDG